MKNKKSIIILLILTVVCLFIDQLTKYIVTENMNVADTIHIIRNFFRITYVQNTGAAWSIFAGNTIFLILISIVVLGIFIHFLLKKDKLEKDETIIYGVLMGGIFGNLIDRIRYGYVIDFFDFNFGSFDYPIFNIADIMIVLAGIFLIIKILKEDVK